MPDVSLVLALHREGHFLPRTLRSLAEAAIYARGYGITTELVAVLDRSDEVTAAALKRFDFCGFEQHKILCADNGSLGLTRNDGCRASTGTYILTADGDDLISFNMIERMVRQARQLGPTAILMPEFIFAFGASFHIAEYFGLDQVTPLALLTDNPFVSRVFFHQSLCDRLSYEDVSLTNGYAYEDWHFNCNAVALGYTFHATPETILFYRQSADSLLARGNRVSIRQIPPSPFFRPDRYRQVCGPWIAGMGAEGDFRPAVRSKGRSVLDNPIYLELLLAANEIDPTVDLRRLQDSACFNYLGVNTAAAAAYYRLCEIVGDLQFDEVFLLPFLTTGGADRYVLNVMDALVAQDPGKRMLVLFGERFQRYAWLESLPSACTYIDLFQVCPELGPYEHDLLCLKLIQSCAGNARMHLRSSSFAQRLFERFAPVLGVHRPVFYRFADGRNTYGDLTLVEPSGFHFVAEHIEILDQVVCDNDGIRRRDQQRLQYMPEKWKLLYSRMDIPDRLNELSMPSGEPRSVLWVSRLDAEKRPSLLVQIARLLAVKQPDVVIHVFGRPTLHDFDVGQITTLSNVRYHGEFDRFEDLQISRHCCFVYTSHFDGMPTVLLEMAAAGLPVIAPDVGGISELIRDRDTGLLLQCSGDDSADAELYVSAITTMLNDPELRESIRRHAFALMQERHAPARYAEHVADIFGLRRVTPDLSVCQ